MTFLGDEGRDVLVVKRMIVDHKFTLLGPTSSVGGFFLGPVYYYFMIPFLWAWNLDPVGPAIMVALFGILTVYLVYISGRDMFSESAGFTASGLYAISPLIIAYSRSSWNPNIVPFFSLLLIYSLWKLAVTRKAGWSLVAGICLGIGIQLHYLFSFLFAVAFIWLGITFILKLTRSAWVYLALIIGYLTGNSLFLLFEVRHGFPNTRSIIQFIFAGKETGLDPMKFIGTVWFVIYRIFGRLLVRLPEDGMLANFDPNLTLLWKDSVYVIIIICVTVYIGYFRKSLISFLTSKTGFRSKQADDKSGFYSALLTGIWMIVPVILFGFYKKGIYDYYFGIIFPLPFLLAGLVFDRFSGFKIWKYLGCLILFIMLAVNWQGRPFLYTPNSQLQQAKNIARVAYEKTGGKPFNFALLAGNNTDHSYRYFFEIWGNPPVTIENTQIDPDRKTVMNQLIIICEESDCKPLGHPLWEIAGFGRAEIIGQWDVSFVKIYKLVHYQQPDEN
jgi:4-amino-4-deoxy-L-arabinose transferase-like glycosyltransferase